MSRFFSKKYSTLVPYTPGEQPKDVKYIKLNTNESPYPPSKGVIEAVSKEGGWLQLYSDPECSLLHKELSSLYKVEKSQVLATNGSDEILNFAFMAFSDKENPIVFPDITYGFYPVFAEINNIPYEKIPLKDDFSIDVNDYIGINKNIVIANPNAPTGMYLELCEIEKIVKSNPNNVIIIDEAYIDFGGESAIPLTQKYDNLIVTRTFSKSYSMAGARLGFGVANEALIADMNTIKYSTNPYNVNRMSQIAGVFAIRENDYYMSNCAKIIEARKYATKELEGLGFKVLPSCANFVFAKSESIGGEELYLELKSRGILIRHFTSERIKDFNRITIGTKEQMEFLIKEIKSILEEKR
ncbi:MAG: histidinol-phosphate transaminase [Clostridia bacterium]|nr:histidinol-phosphate transaminase [Clostridia bacterium]